MGKKEKNHTFRCGFSGGRYRTQISGLTHALDQSAKRHLTLSFFLLVKTYLATNF